MSFFYSGFSQLHREFLQFWQTRFHTCRLIVGNSTTPIYIQVFHCIQYELIIHKQGVVSEAGDPAPTQCLSCGNEIYM